MIIKNRSTIWHYLKKKLCPASQNQVDPIPLAFINVNQVPAAQNITQDDVNAATTSELLSIITLTFSIVSHCIYYAMVSMADELTGKTNVIMRIFLQLATITITHILWITISPKLRKFTMEIFIKIKDKCSF